MIRAGGVFSNVPREAVCPCVGCFCPRCARRGVILSLTPHAAVRLVPRFSPRSSCPVHPFPRTITHEHAKMCRCSLCSFARGRISVSDSDSTSAPASVAAAAAAGAGTSTPATPALPSSAKPHPTAARYASTRHWLMKNEPPYSLSALRSPPSQTEPWVGVRNHEARNIMVHAMRRGQEVLYYNASVANPHVAGLARVASGSYPDHTAWDPNSLF